MPKATSVLSHWRGSIGPRAVRDPMHAGKQLAWEPGDPALYFAALGSVRRSAHREAQGRTAMSRGRGKSDCGAVPRKLPNKAAGETLVAAEVVAGRRQAKGNADATLMSYSRLDLSDRPARGAYRPQPVRRVYIDKVDGSKRPLGLPALEDKLVQRATGEVLNAVYEQDFVGFSYSFRPRKSEHNALDAVSVGVSTRWVNWILDADISKFHDTIEHDWLIKFIEHRVADTRVVRPIKKWLHAGVLDEGRLERSEVGTVQGGSISPLLANIYLHYVFKLLVKQWRARHAEGDMIAVRYADGWVAEFQYLDDAARFQRAVLERLAQFGLTCTKARHG